MIGVVAKPEEAAAVEEFFQLFKTPWELYQEGAAYDVVLVTGGEVPEADARLLLIYGAGIRESDREANLSPCARRQPTSVHRNARQFPLYGGSLTFAGSSHRAVCTTDAGEVLGVEVKGAELQTLRIGFDLFQEIWFLLTTGQPVENAHIPTLELHISLLRDLILDAGISLVEIPPTPAGYEFTVCLTHDIDFVGIRRHRFDHTMWGFLYRATAGAALNFLRGRVSLSRLWSSWKAAASLPLVYLGWIKDFWMPFEWYLQVEQGLSPTYFFIPFKHRPGEKVSVPHSERRASAYDIGDIPEWIERLKAEGCEIGVHGIDAWHSAEKGREELARVAALTGGSQMGIRMHWLLRDEQTDQVLEQAGYHYDSTAGYNETPGYRCGTTQAFRTLRARNLFELPMHIQDGALFFPGRLGLSDAEAWARCQVFIANVKKLGGVLTVLWHDRSPGPERFWGDFYARLVQDLKSRPVWFATAGQAVAWFRKRREITFKRGVSQDGTPRTMLCGCGAPIAPPLQVRLHSPEGARGHGSEGVPDVVEIAWDGDADLDLDTFAKAGAAEPVETLAGVARM